MCAWLSAPVVNNTRKIVVSFFGVGLVIVIAIAIGLSFWVFNQIDSAAAARKHSFLLIRHIENLISELSNAESGQRGYALTNDKTFLDPYYTVRDKVRTDLQEMQRLTNIGSAQESVSRLTPLVIAKLDEMSQVIALHQSGNINAELNSIKNGTGKRLMEKIIEEKTRYVFIADTILAQQDTQLKDGIHLLFIVTVAASFLLFLFALLSVYSMHRETQNQLKKLAHRDTRNLLEKEEATNRQLQITNVNLQLSQEKLEVTLNSIADGVMVTNAAAQVILLNPVAERLTGWSHTEATGRSSEEIFKILDHTTRQPKPSPVLETLSNDAAQGLVNHTILVNRDKKEPD